MQDRERLGQSASGYTQYPIIPFGITMVVILVLTQNVVCLPDHDYNQFLINMREIFANENKANDWLMTASEPS